MDISFHAWLVISAYRRRDNRLAAAAQQSAKADDIIHFRASLSLTSPLSTKAKGAKLGYDFYVKHINNLGGIEVAGKNTRSISNNTTPVVVYPQAEAEAKLQLN